MTRMASRFAVAFAVITITLLSTFAQAANDPELRKLLRQAVQSDWGFEDRFDAQVWLLDMSQRLKRFVPDAATRIDMLKTIHYESRRVGIEPELVLAVIEVESHFD